ncbi:F0F1 ATP synthase subunit alpha [Candidatus Woesebacteria bacterium RIFCSPHIGHO2_02_FULL_38_9]|uniref:ATP synthase subunit alpha n=1 Tax=Candidatus Woesebacteria bacterium RIFCSPHIGHO2_01_FULL_39_28 TaxID=1802496 RepID=A0A1F7YEE7_9BACT|nr:MAG: F0F1 ATP synthase subunit alpha [Candidatus Woesebacteria bacterium RIFCSPHIGHO2_01_FULL_39_28]OGM33959.1 MAG: F0F1 ATP synthase subunit alpha [Candidatus Woesebacteria bacterium RIFCSPHIGHO2_02_FULL_38_9]OGM57580.1 MAG: F0F1 ATP synthase subunit alpha [Candidatus Woesebacteria bacterium RIFCSPLOWO2_01_FULL_38_20]
MDNANELTLEIIKKLADFKAEPEHKSTGTILSIYDGVAFASGLKDASYLEMVEFPYGIYGVVFNLEETRVGIIILGDYLKLKEGDKVTVMGKLLSIPVGKNLIGRVVNPLGTPLDARGEIKTEANYPVEKIAPSVVARSPVDTPLITGIKAIDSMIPLGRGQRELIIGDRSTGKTQITLDAIINQKDGDLICIYVAIGQKTSKIAQFVDALSRFDSLKHTIVVAASAADPVSFQYLAPYAGCAIGEYFMDRGQDALIIYDDLTKHAWAYRQISLILRRPSGREAYPGDIFYLHSRLLERACKLNKGGSLTALPIIETQAGDVSAYIPTNVISITDGQIYLESDLFNAGVRPAISAGLSVSRVGGAAQTRAMKKLAGKLRLDLAQYKELSNFSQFASDLDEATKKQIEHGGLMTELLKQPPFSPLAIELETLVLWAAINGYMNDLKLSDVANFEKLLISYFQKNENKTLIKIKKEASIDEKTDQQLKHTLDKFKIHWNQKNA